MTNAAFARRAIRHHSVPVMLAALLGAIAVVASGCLPAIGGSGNSASTPNRPSGPRVQSITLTDRIVPAGVDHPVTLAAAKNEWTSFAIEISGLPKPAAQYMLRLRAPRRVDAAGEHVIEPSNFEPSQIIAMPIDVNRAGYVRHTGQSAAVRELPRALLPVGHDNGLINLRSLRNPKRAPGDKSAPAGPGNAPLHLWIDLHVPEATIPGEYSATCDLIPAGTDKPIASLPLKLTVHNFVIPNERHLQVVGRIAWETLKNLYGPQFETVRPQLLNRGDERYAAAVRTLDQLISLAQRHRTTVVVPRLQPTVKWPAGQPPEVDWSDFDSVAGPWLSGTLFADRTPLTFWPLPAPDHLDNFDRKSRNEYWTIAAQHFDTNDWLGRSPVWLEKTGRGRVRPADAVELSAKAAEVVRLHPRVRATVPLSNDQLHLADAESPGMIERDAADRVWAAAPGLVFAPPVQLWEGDPKRLPEQWLRTDVPGLVPYVGAGGDERDVRLWAWLAFLRQAKLIIWNGVLPGDADPAKPADPNDLIWFYPGEWFGIDQPVPTVQLKWLRRAQQDFEYLRLAKERGEVLNALVMARLMTKPVEIVPGQIPDPAYALMCGTTDPRAWSEAHRLLAQTILLREPGKEPNADAQHAVYLETLRWMQPQERPLLMGRTTQWSPDIFAKPADGGEKPDKLRELTLRLGIDIYNASDTRPDKNHLQWVAVPQGWEVRPQPIEISALATYHVRREYVEAQFDLTKVAAGSPQTMEVNFIDGFTNRASPLKLVVPVAATERVEGRRLSIDGALGEWDAADLIQNGPMVTMLSRPIVQQQELKRSEQAARVYTGWAEDNFYVAFDLRGIVGGQFAGSQNFANYQFRRAWGEDLAEVLVQPIYANGQSGPVLHVVFKPSGMWVERKLDERVNVDPWQPVEGAAIRYKAVVGGPGRDNWLGEAAIPWAVIGNPQFGPPVLLRFNFVQHRTATGESASWAGPIDFGRDDAFTGILHVRDADAPGLGPVRDAAAD